MADSNAADPDIIEPDIADLQPREDEPSRRFDPSQIPGFRQGLLLVGIAAAVAIGVVVVLWSRAPDYSLLYSQLPPEDMASVVKVLESNGVKYKLNNASSAIMVPRDDVAQARLTLAAQGLPQTGDNGQDIVASTSSSFGVSNFQQKKQYQHLLEKDLARTISHLKPVRGAQVHLALPKQSAFIRRRKPASASVLVDLFPGHLLNHSQVQSIVHLVASSVANLDASDVTVVDQQGTLLTDKDNSLMAVTNRHYRLRRQVEQTYASRIKRILSPIVGAKNVHAQVVIDMDFTHRESASDRYSPDNTVRSEQTSRSQRVGEKPPIGIPGALSNRPPPQNQANDDQQAQDNDGDNRSRQTTDKATRNYEISHTISHVKQPLGQIDRVSAAVVVDNVAPANAGAGDAQAQPLSQAELDQLTQLVRGAIGYDARRGDSVSVVNAAFAKQGEMQPVQVPWWKRPVIRNYIKEGLGILVVIALIFFILRPLFRNLVHPPGTDAPQLEGPDEEPIAETEEDLVDDVFEEDEDEDKEEEEKSVAELEYEEKVSIAKRLAKEDPKRVAQVVTDWVGEDG